MDFQSLLRSIEHSPIDESRPSWQGTGSATVHNGGAWSNTTAGQTDTSSVSGSASRSHANASMPRLPPRVNTTIPPAAAVASLAAVRPRRGFGSLHELHCIWVGVEAAQ